MRLFSFLKFFDTTTEKTDFTPNEYIPTLWENNYCQIEIVPAENENFILKQSEQIGELASKSGAEYGFTESVERGAMPVPTMLKKIRVEYLENILNNLQFHKANHIRYQANKIFDCESSKTKAYGFSNFTIFFDIEREFIKNIWIDVGLIVSAPQFELIQEAFYALGTECKLILIDWNSLELLYLTDKNQIQKYLLDYWK